MRLAAPLRLSTCPFWTGMGGHFGPETPATFNQKVWPFCSGITGHFQSEWMATLLRNTQRVTAASDIRATNGNIVLQNKDEQNGLIIFDSGTVLEAYGNSGTTGIIKVFLGAVLSGNYLPHPPAVPETAVTIPMDEPIVCIGVNNISAQGPLNIILAQHSAIYIDAKERPSGIQFTGSNYFKTLGDSVNSPDDCRSAQ